MKLDRDAVDAWVREQLDLAPDPATDHERAARLARLLGLDRPLPGKAGERRDAS